MELREIMTAPPVFVYLETPIWRAARAMEDNNCSFLPVVHNGVPIGVVTMRDLTAAVALEGHCPFKTYAADVMTSPVLGLPGGSSLEDAAILMRQRNIHRIVVTDERGILRGVVSLGDLSAYFNQDSVIRTMQRLNENSGPSLMYVHQPWLPHLTAA